MLASSVEPSAAAAVVLQLSVAAFVAGELVLALRTGRRAVRADLRAEILFRAMFFWGIFLLPAGRAAFPGAVVRGVWLFGLGGATATESLRPAVLDSSRTSGDLGYGRGRRHPRPAVHRS